MSTQATRRRIKRTIAAGTVLFASTSIIADKSAASCSPDPYLASICLTAATYCPSGYLPADGRRLTISNYGDLFALVGLTYGGEAGTEFALPDLRGAVPLGTGESSQGVDVKPGATQPLSSAEAGGVGADAVGLKYCIAVKGEVPPRY